jgi:hypothetical protein
MISAFNALLECFVTGLVTALILYFMGRMGWLPFIVVLTPEEAEEFMDDN